MDAVPTLTSSDRTAKSIFQYKIFDKKYFIIGLFSLLFLVIASFVYTWISSPMVVSVVGVGEVSVPPEKANISLSLSSADVISATAVQNVQTKAEAIKVYMKSTGILDENISETQIQVVPASLVTAGTSGYQAILSISFSTSQLASLSNLVANLYSKGAAIVSQPILTVEDTTNVEQLAFNKAFDNAKKQAQDIAMKNSKFIKKIVAVSQSTAPSTSSVTSQAIGATQNENEQTMSSSVFKVTKQVLVSYKMW